MNDSILMFVAQRTMPNQVAAIMARTELSLREQTTQSVMHEAKLPENVDE
jgi:hypothetical protein